MIAKNLPDHSYDYMSKVPTRELEGLPLSGFLYNLSFHHLPSAGQDIIWQFCNSQDATGHSIRARTVRGNWFFHSSISRGNFANLQAYPHPSLCISIDIETASNTWPLLVTYRSFISFRKGTHSGYSYYF